MFDADDQLHNVNIIVLQFAIVSTPVTNIGILKLVDVVAMKIDL